MFKKLWIYGALLCTGLSQAQQTQTRVESLDEVVLIDSKFELKRENSGKVVAKITAKELERSSGQSIAEIINRVSGIEINGSRSAEGLNLGYYVRGGRNRQVVIMVDGIQLSDPSAISNDFDLRLLPLDQVASIEIIKGASSTLYGSGAATAVISITTKEPANKKIGIQLQSSLGTNQTQGAQEYVPAQFDNALGLSGRLSKFNYQVNLSHRQSENMSAIKPAGEEEGFQENPFSKHSVYARLGYKINEQLKFYVYGNFDEFSSSFDDSFMYADADNELESEQFRAGSHWEVSYKNGSFIFNDSYSELDREVKSDFPNTYDARVYAFDAYNKYVFEEKIHTILGVNGIFSDFNSFDIPFGETEFQQAISDTTANFEIVDPYINAVYVSGFGFNLNAGTRLNIHSQYGEHWVYNVNPSYTYPLKEGYLKALTSYSTAYITPSLYQLFAPNYGNPDLNPEESSTFEAGLEFQSKKAAISAVYFKRNSENFIDFVTVDPANFISEYQNVAEEFSASGVEVELTLELPGNLDFTGNYTFTEVDQKFALRIPRHKINAQLGLSIFKNTFSTLSYQFNDERTDSFYNNETFENELVVLKGFGVLDYYISHQVNDHLKIFAGLNNLTNEKYEEIYRYSTRGRNARLGLALNF